MMSGRECCPCDSGLVYGDCCGRYIVAAELPQTAEQLMRSRYCAYVQQDSDYILRTWYAMTRPAQLDLAADKALKWLGLKIVATEAGDADDNSAVVEFVARYKVNGKAGRLQERSHFKRIAGQWLYVDGSNN